MKLSEALKIQKDIVESLKAMQKSIIKHNSYKTDQENNLDIKSLLNRQKDIREILVSLKLAIREANEPIAEDIFKLSELKEEKKCYERINIKKGTFVENNSEIKYDVIITEKEAKKRIKELNTQIEKINNSLKYFNDSIEIDVDLSKYLGIKIKKKI